MSVSDQRAETLSRWLALTEEEEFDCDAFLAYVAAFVDGAIDDRAQRALMEHHLKICSFCDEEITILSTALGLSL